MSRIEGVRHLAIKSNDDIRHAIKEIKMGLAMIEEFHPSYNHIKKTNDNICNAHKALQLYLRATDGGEDARS